MIRVKEAVVVEGKYDLMRLKNVVDGLIVPVGGFRLFRDKETMAMLRSLAETRGLLILTDSDAAGMVIRNKLVSAIPNAQIRHAYIPPIKGKEKRKTAPSKEGLLGVEGMDEQALEEAIRASGATVGDTAGQPAWLTKQRMLADGLSGGKNSAALRKRLLEQWRLPEYLSANRLMDYINAAVPETVYEKCLCAAKEDFEKSLDMGES